LPSTAPSIGRGDGQKCRAIAAEERLAEREADIYSKRPFGGPQAALAYLSRHTHRVAIANSRLISLTNTSVPRAHSANDQSRPRQLTPSAMAIATRSSHRNTPPPQFRTVLPLRQSRRPRLGPLPVALKSP
jgi:hypothetical protein